MGCRVERGDTSDKSMRAKSNSSCALLHTHTFFSQLLKKEDIHKRVHSDLPAFDQQLSSSKYVQERLQALETNVDKLSDTLSHSEVRGASVRLVLRKSAHVVLRQASSPNSLTP